VCCCSGSFIRSSLWLVRWCRTNSSPTPKVWSVARSLALLATGRTVRYSVEIVARSNRDSSAFGSQISIGFNVTIFLIQCR
jgi:hypothetical protein